MLGFLAGKAAGVVPPRVARRGEVCSGGGRAPLDVVHCVRKHRCDVRALDAETYELVLPPAVGLALQKFTAKEGVTERQERLNALAAFLLDNGAEHKQYPLATYIAQSASAGASQVQPVALENGGSRFDPIVAAHAASVNLFAASYRGEWAGYECVFGKKTGEIQVLEEYELPDGFRELGVIPVGFESSNSCTVRGSMLYRKHFRILPSLCTFGDHIDIEEDLYAADLSEPHCVAFLDGSYSLGHAKHDPEAPTYVSPKKIEFGLMYPGESQTRQRITVRFGIHAGVGKIVSDPQVFLEHFEMDYCGGQVIQGGSGFTQGWGSEPLRDMSILDGTWKSLKDGTLVERKAPILDPQATLVMPHGITISIEKPPGSEAYHVQVGWLPDGQGTHRSLITQKIDSKTGEFMAAVYDIEVKV
ncbi:hypothetical protein FVE85_2920 [Porphyridium purpureum]|uniref:Uncharacterized protein n=1 Tax=Porphyridium purpureum TaxID=35688 RepID=A0A5J4YT90_PORPP|nr:hypothetical protein FVE85_2920 [Porphyridium purpureum]|eukprot:POR6625..scf227_4